MSENVPSEEPHRIGLFRLLLLIPEYYRKAGTCVKVILTLPKHYVDRSEHRVLRLPFFILCWPLIMLIILPLTIDNWRYAREQRKKRAT